MRTKRTKSKRKHLRKRPRRLLRRPRHPRNPFQRKRRLAVPTDPLICVFLITFHCARTKRRNLVLSNILIPITKVMLASLARNGR